MYRCNYVKDFVTVGIDSVILWKMVARKRHAEYFVKHRERFISRVACTRYDTLTPGLTWLWVKWLYWNHFRIWVKWGAWFSYAREPTHRRRPSLWTSSIMTADGRNEPLRSVIRNSNMLRGNNECLQCTLFLSWGLYSWGHDSRLKWIKSHSDAVFIVSQ
jgi:hypothetical protein